MIAELDRSDEVEELLADSTKQASITKKKKAVNGVEGELEENVAALCDLFENESFLEKGKVIKVFEEPHTKTLTLCFRNQLLKAKLEGEGRDHILFKKGDAYAGSTCDRQGLDLHAVSHLCQLLFQLSFLDLTPILHHHQ